MTEPLNLEPVEHDYVKSDVQKRYPDISNTKPVTISGMVDSAVRAFDNVMALVVVALIIGCVVGLLALLVYSVAKMTAVNWLYMGCIFLGYGIYRGVRRLDNWEKEKWD